MSGGYQHQEYPKRMYHATEQPRTVQSEREEKDLGPEWADHPDKARENAARRSAALNDDMDRAAKKKT
jgi:hypothetical protein